MRIYYTPRILRRFGRNYATWQMPENEKNLYLTFDDGPSPELTGWILGTLKKYNAEATFFCVGDNVKKYPGPFASIISQEHSVGNHTYNHLNGWKTDLAQYKENVKKASALIHSDLFRPPYGKMTLSQAKMLKDAGYKSILWSVLTYDFDNDANPEKSWQKMIRHTKSGSILVFHDNPRAERALKILLPRTLEYFGKQGYAFRKII